MEIVRPDFLPITLILIWRYRARRSLRLSFGVRTLRLCGICFIKTKHTRLRPTPLVGIAGAEEYKRYSSNPLAYTTNTEDWLQQPLPRGQRRTREPELPREIHSLFCGFAFFELRPGAAVNRQLIRERVGGRRDFL